MERVNYKNRLQDFTQKSRILLPVYRTINEGSPQAARFTSTVNVNGSCYQSSNAFSNRKEAEQDVARVALESIPQKPKEESLQFLPLDTSLCKSIMNEYADKMNLDKPTYATKQAQGYLPVFVSEILVDGVKYTGQRAKNKKEAERIAARAAILSIMDSEPKPKMIMSEVIKSKKKMYASLYDADVNHSVVGDNVPESGGRNSSSLEISFGKRKDVTAPEDMTTINSVNIGSTAVNVGSTAIAQPFHEFTKPEGASLEDIPHPITFVPPSSFPRLGDKEPESGGRNSGLEVSLGKRKDVTAPEDMTTINSFNVLSTAIAQPFHEFTKPKGDSSLEYIPLTFVSPSSFSTLEFVPCPSSAKSKSRKKNKSQKVEECGTQISDSINPLGEAPLSEAPPCPVSQ